MIFITIKAGESIKEHEFQSDTGFCHLGRRFDLRIEKIKAKSIIKAQFSVFFNGRLYILV